jgi:hypothetical protein
MPLFPVTCIRFSSDLPYLSPYTTCHIKRFGDSTMAIFDRRGVRHTGLFTFAQSAKHVGLYQKFGYWPRYLTAIMTRTPGVNSASQVKPVHAPALLSAFTKSQREQAIQLNLPWMCEGEDARSRRLIETGQALFRPHF